MQPRSTRQKQHNNQGAAKQGSENQIKSAAYITAMGQTPEATPITCGSQASINIATQVIDYIHRSPVV